MSQPAEPETITAGESSPVRLVISDGLAQLTLSRPDQLNTIDLSMATALAVAARQLAANAQVRAVLIDGAGRSFCGGGDLRSFAAHPDLSAHLSEVMTALHAALAILARLDAPVVIAVHGAAAGAGLGLACSGDIVLAADTAKFVFAYGALGFTPDGGTSWWLPRLVGPRAAMELALTNRVLGATEAAALGLITRVVDQGALAAEALAVARGLAAGPTAAMGGTKRLLRAGFSTSLEAQLAAEQETLSVTAQGSDAAEGVAAFLEKRAPHFRGGSTAEQR